MLRAEKAELIDDLNGMFKSSAVVVVAHYKGMTVAELTDLRSQVRKAGGRLRVAKNLLAKRALDETEFGGIGSLLKGPTALIYSADPVAAPKAASEYAKKNEKLQILGGGLGATLLDPAAVKALAELPSLDALRAGIVGILQAPAQKLVRLLQTPGGQVARVLRAHADKAGETAE